jgi:Coenzyme PQQ synthesis protein D (PqqD)
MGMSIELNAAEVVHETIDGEAILIHLGTGTYYSLDGVAAELWGVVAAGADRDGVLVAAQQRYEGDPEHVRASVNALIEELLGQGLLVQGPPAPAVDQPRLPAGQVPFAEPELHTYTDMQEFMLVDPLHEVDEAAGWPHAKTA